MYSLSVITLLTPPRGGPPPTRAEPWSLQTVISSDYENNETFSITLDGAGDLNGDGIPDAIIGDCGRYAIGEAAYVFYGTPCATFDETIILHPPDEITSSLYGWKTVGNVDINGDGFDDIAISDPWVGISMGTIHIYYGIKTGLKLTPHSIYEEDHVDGYSFGWDLDSAGDINGDGFADLISGGTYQYDTSAGAVFLLYGSASGIVEQQRVEPSDGIVDDDYGRIVSGGGDINADGFSDILVASESRDTATFPHVGAAYVHYGSASGIIGEDILVASDIAAVDVFASALSFAGDIDNDGYDDLVIGSPFDDSVASWSGSIYVYYGSVTGISSREDNRYAPDGVYGDWFGNGVWDAGDIDNDSYSDVMVYSRDQLYSSNAGYIFYGSSSGLSWEHHKIKSPDPSSSEGFMHSFASVGDLTGDGFGEFLIGGGSTRAYLFTAAPEGTVIPDIEECEDQDGDGSLAYDDCNDEDASIHPGAEEVCGDNIDNNCDGFGTAQDDEDSDGLSSLREAIIGTDPCAPDSDGDGFSDGEEHSAGSDPLDSDDYPREPDPAQDTATTPQDTGTPPKDTGTTPQDEEEAPRECGCAAGSQHAPSPAWLLLPVLLFLRRAQER